MKKIAFLCLSLLMAAGVFAQTAEDALTLSQEFPEGTARSVAMGNAFTALGGDLGAIAINPASSGVYRCSQFSFSPSLTTARAETNYLGNTSASRKTGLTVSNLGVVLTFDTGNYTGLLNYNFGFVYNTKNSYRSVMKAYGSTDNSSMLSSIAAGLEGIDWSEIDLESTSSPYTTSSASWPGILAWNTYVLAPLSVLGGQYADVNDSYIASTENYNADTDELRIGGTLNQRFNRKTYGSNGEFSINFGGNVSDFLYFGMNINCESVNYTVEEYYEESAQDPSRFDDGFVSMDNSYWLRTSGAGANFKFGAILTPVAGLRLGATFTTPTWYTLTDEWDYTMNTAFNNGNTYTQYSPTGTYTYQLTAPMRWSVGAAYTFAGQGLLSVDYEGVNYGDMKFLSENGTTGIFGEENAYIGRTFQNAHVLRAGLEIRMGKSMALRGGYQYHSSPIKGVQAARKVYSAGVGFDLSQTTTLDFAWTRIGRSSDTFQLYDDYSSAVTVPTGTNTRSLSKLICTLAVKF